MIGDIMTVQFSDKLIDKNYIKEKIIELFLLLGPEEKAELLEIMNMDEEGNIKQTAS